VERTESVRPARRPAPSPDRDQLLEWVERVATFFRDQYNLPPITGRIFGWLMVCDPPEQSGAQIAEAIGASRASITTNMRLLVGGDLVRRLARPGDRTTYYVVDDDAWESVIRRRIQQMMSFAQITADAIELVGATGERASRARAAHEAFEWLAEVLRNAAPIQRQKGRRR
jgi:DNA-binding transcriptional regulator GbsR (MarR family)